MKATNALSLRNAAIAALLACIAMPVGVVLAEKADKPVKPTNSAVVVDAAKPAVVIDAAKYADLQTAFDAVPQAGGLVKLPPGNFELTEPLVLATGDTRVEGSGTATHLINRNTKGKPALIVRPKKGGKEYRWRVQLADFRISGNPKSGDGLLADHINEIYISGLSVDHNGGNGISLIHCLEDPRVCGSIITYNAKTGLNIIGGHDIVVNANQFEENKDALHCINGYNLCMNGNNLDDHLGDGVVVENTYGSVLSGNMIEECKGAGIVMDRDCYGNTISANVIAHNVGGGVDLRDAHGCAVSANTFVLDHKRGIAIGPKSDRITITGNAFCNSHIGGGLRRAKTGDEAQGILLDTTSDINITGNVFSGLARQAVEAKGKCVRIIIIANSMVDLSRAAPGKHAPMELGESQADVRHNQIGPSDPAKK